MEAVKKLRKILSDLGEKNDNNEASELFEEIYEDLRYEISEQEDEIKDLKNKLDELEEQLQLISENLGLDTIHYHLESGNLKVSQQLESAFNLIKS